jgi:probable phosphoglycerate mutase
MSAAATPPLRLYYIRHAETAWTHSGQLTGDMDIPLTADGEDRARALGPWLRQAAFTQVLTSPRIRARRTCALAGLGADAQVEPDMAEWDYGDYQGRLTIDVRAEHPGWNVFRDGAPNGETPDEVSTRADRLITRLLGLNGNVALFSHAHFGAVLAARWIGLPVFEGRHFPLAPCSVSILGFAARRPEDRVIDLWNGSENLAHAPPLRT